MQNIDNIIEIKRGLHKVCSQCIVNLISNSDWCENFYKDVFIIYGLTYNTETIRQKRVFIAESAKYFIFDRLSKDDLYLKDGKYETNNKKELKKLLENTLEVFFKLHNSCESNEDFKKEYAKYFGEEVKDFSKEISENRDDSLSDFAKIIQKVYYSKDKNPDC